MRPKLSIIIPCFNAEETIIQAVESCFTQALSIPFEIVLVDDGSTDATLDILKKLKEQHPEVVVGYHGKNQGGGATRNTAARISSGNVFFFLDSDDILPTGTLKKMYDCLIEMGSDGIAVSISTKFKGMNIQDIERKDKLGFEGKRIPVISLFQKDDMVCPLYSTFMITKKAFDECGGYPEDHGFDTQGLAWRFLSKGLSAYTCPDTEYYHRVNFTKSYYLREAEQGKVNYNWKNIFLEHFKLFNKEAQDVILAFDCSDFTKSLYDAVRCLKSPFVEGYENILGTDLNYKGQIPAPRYVSYNSPYGLYLRIKNYVRKKSR